MSGLGYFLTVTKDLSLWKYTSDIVKKAHCRANMIHRCFVSQNVFLLARSFTTYVKPLLEYNSVTWSPSLKRDTQRKLIHGVSKNVPPSTCYNLDIPNPITIIFGRRVTKKVENHRCFVFPPHLSSAFAQPCETVNPEIASFHLNTVCCFANEHTTHIYIITWSLLNYPSFPK